jgi:hypothetical protein
MLVAMVLVMMVLILCVLAAELNGFTPSKSHNSLSMVRHHQQRLYKGKSREEIGLSKKQLFRQVRLKIEEASQRPGFFDPPEGKPVSTFMS